MAYAITEKCLGEVYATCTTVCPVACIHPVTHAGRPFMVIDPAICIDCGLCLPECPIGAIVGPGEDPGAEALNRDLTPPALDFERAHGKPPVRQPNEPPRRPDNRLSRGG